MKLFKVVDIKEALKILRESFPKTPDEGYVNLAEALGRVLSEDITSKENIPGFRRSAVDGYSIKASASSGASEAMPAIFTLIDEINMGESASRKLQYINQCSYVPTGGMIPEGADSIVMIEYSEKLDDETILINKAAYPGENLVEEDEDIALGERILCKGSRLKPYDIGMLSALGIMKVKVYKKMRFGIISTGDEIVSPEIVPQKGQVRDINTYLLDSLIKEAGGDSVIYGVCKDELTAVKDTLIAAKDSCDIVLISGGSSVGKKDETLMAIESIEGARLLVKGIAIKPGKPTIIAKAGDKLIIGLPGHPLACAVVFKALIQEYLNNKYGVNIEEYPIPCSLSINYHKAKGREEFLPVSLKYEKEELKAVPIITKSGIISSFSKAFGYIRIAKNIEGLREGEGVLVHKF